jgi:hypothetical protein
MRPAGAGGEAVLRRVHHKPWRHQPPRQFAERDLAFQPRERRPETGMKLVVDAVGKFGLNVSSAAYTGPLIQNFASDDSILLKDLTPAG